MSFDTLHFKLTKDTVNADFMAETPCYLSNVSEHNFADGGRALTGDLSGAGNSIYKVTITDWQLTVKDCSFCKWVMGNNFTELDRRDTKRGVEMLSDMLHLPFDLATIPRLDFAVNLVVNYPTTVYQNHLGALAHYSRLQQPTAVYYNQQNEQFLFYDKVREQKRAGAFIPELYNGKNVLRIEQRYIKRVNSRLGNVVGSMLYDEQFYSNLLARWRDTYYAIKKINDVTPNFKIMATKRDLYKMGVVALIEKAGGANEMLGQIKEAQQMGTLTKKQAFELRCAVNEAMQSGCALIVPNEAIMELDKKVKQAVKIFR